jgi:hypothetical protein
MPTPRNPRLAELVDRGERLAAARVADTPEPVPEEVPTTPAPVPDRPTTLRLVQPERAVLETNLARKGIWAVAPPRAAGDEQLVLALDAHDRLGIVRRIDAGPSLTTLDLEVAAWLCSRWREAGDPASRRVPLSLAGLLSDFGWKAGGHNRARMSAALDALVVATFGLEVYDARTGEPRYLRRFSIIDEWAAGDPHRTGRLGSHGHALVSDWLREQLLARHFTYIDWQELRALERPVAKRLLVFLEAERFEGAVKRWAFDDALFVTLGLGQGNPRRTRQMLTAAGADLVAVVPRYRRVEIERRANGPGWVLTAERRQPRP